MQIRKGSIVNDATLELDLDLNSVSSIKDKTSPVYSVNPSKANLVRSIAQTISAAATIYTTPSSKDFYLTSIQLSYTKDATFDGNAVYISVVVDGATHIIACLAANSTVKDHDHLEMNYTFPIKIDRNSVIQICGTFTAGTCSKLACISGFVL